MGNLGQSRDGVPSSGPSGGRRCLLWADFGPEALRSSPRWQQAEDTARWVSGGSPAILVVSVSEVGVIIAQEGGHGHRLERIQTGIKKELK